MNPVFFFRWRHSRSAILPVYGGILNAKTVSDLPALTRPLDSAHLAAEATPWWIRVNDAELLGSLHSSLRSLVLECLELQICM
jgi:hypothetical protein